MSNNTLLNKMAHLLMIKGLSVTEARERVNQSKFAQQQALKIVDGELDDIHSIQSLVADMPGIAAVAEEFKDELTHHQSFNQQTMELKQRRILLSTGWDAFKGIRWSSTIYLSLLTSIIATFHIFVIPAFSEVYSYFHVEFPYLTSLYFTDGYLAFIMLLLIWFFTVAYLFIIMVINKRIKKFTLIPSWISSIPFIGSASRMINQCILLSLYHFIISSNTFVLPEHNDWQKKFNLFENKSLYQWSSTLYEQLKLAFELDIANEYLQDELDNLCQQYIDKTTRSIKLFSIISSIILAAFIGTIVIAMYLPIFSMGLLI